MEQVNKLTIMDRFADPLDRSFLPFVSHPAAAYAETATEDFGGLFERLCLFDYRDLMPNPVCRGIQCMLTPMRDHYPSLEARFMFAVMLTMERSVQQLVIQDIERALTPTKAASTVAFFKYHYLSYARQAVDQIMRSSFDKDNAKELLVMLITKLQATWARQDTAEIKQAWAGWDAKNREDYKQVQRSSSEKSTEKKRTNNKRNMERNLINQRLMSGIAEYWKATPPPSSSSSTSSTTTSSTTSTSSSSSL